MTTLAMTRVYRQSFEAHPHITLAVTGGLFSALGDLAAQMVVRYIRVFLILYFDELM